MVPTDKHNYTKDILNKNFTKIAELVRDGDISSLDYSARLLLAHHLDTKEKPVGRPKDIFKYRLACDLYDNYQALKKYNLTSTQYSMHEALAILHGKNPNDIKNKPEFKKMTRSEVLEKLKKMYFSNSRTLDYKRIEDLITLGGKIRNGKLLIPEEDAKSLPPPPIL